MVRKNGGVAFTGVLKDGEQPGVQPALAMRCDGLLHCKPEQLMAEPQRASIGHQQAGPQAVIEECRRPVDN
jgi:hypothetical protein